MNLDIMSNKYLEKIAQIEQKKDDLQRHQLEALEHLDREKGIVLHHSLGSGKTRVFLKAMQKYQNENPNKRALAITPASLVLNIDKEMKKHGIKLDMNRLDLLSFQKAVNEADTLRKNKYSIAVVDEAHSLRNNKSQRTKTLRDIISGADHRLLATATGNYNNLADMSTLVNIAANDDVLPEDSKSMEKKYVKDEIIKPSFLESLKGKKSETVKTLTNKKNLKETLNKYVDYYDSADDPEAAKYFPKKSEKVVEVEMSPEQEKYYRFTEDKIPFLLKMKLRHNLPLEQKEKASLNAFSMGVRQVSNSYRHLKEDGSSKYTPKIEKAVESLQRGLTEDKNFRGLVYSNYLEAGLDEYSRKLKDLKINHEIYNGSVSREEKSRMVKDFNAGKNKVLLISSSGSEGLDGKGVKKIQLLDGHWNQQKLNQVIGRGVRFKSHEHLPEAERRVEVEKYQSVYKKPLWGKRPVSIDTYMHDHADTKQEVFDEMKDLMKPEKND
jgi:SNF2 family DNA or RNA helicase